MQSDTINSGPFYSRIAEVLDYAENAESEVFKFLAGCGNRNLQSNMRLELTYPYVTEFVRNEI